MNSGGFSYMKSQQASVNDCSHYSKLTSANCAVTKISLAPSVTVPTTQSRKSGPRPPTEKGTRRMTERDRHKIQPLTLKCQIMILIEIHTHSRDSCNLYNFYNLRIIVKLLLLSLVFPD